MIGHHSRRHHHRCLLLHPRQRLRLYLYLHHRRFTNALFACHHYVKCVNRVSCQCAFGTLYVRYLCIIMASRVRLQDVT